MSTRRANPSRICRPVLRSIHHASCGSDVLPRSACTHRRPLAGGMSNSGQAHTGLARVPYPRGSAEPWTLPHEVRTARYECPVVLRFYLSLQGPVRRTFRGCTRCSTPCSTRHQASWAGPYTGDRWGFFSCYNYNPRPLCNSRVQYIIVGNGDVWCELWVGV